MANLLVAASVALLTTAVRADGQDEVATTTTAPAFVPPWLRGGGIVSGTLTAGEVCGPFTLPVNLPFSIVCPFSTETTTTAAQTVVTDGPIVTVTVTVGTPTVTVTLGPPTVSFEPPPTSLPDGTPSFTLGSPTVSFGPPPTSLPSGAPSFTLGSPTVSLGPPPSSSDGDEPGGAPTVTIGTPSVSLSPPSMPTSAPDNSPPDASVSLGGSGGVTITSTVTLRPDPPFTPSPGSDDSTAAANRVPTTLITMRLRSLS